MPVRGGKGLRNHVNPSLSYFALPATSALFYPPIGFPWNPWILSEQISVVLPPSLFPPSPIRNVRFVTMHAGGVRWSGKVSRRSQSEGRPMQIDEAYADSQAPNAAAIKNARGVVLKRKLVGLFRSSDGTL